MLKELKELTQVINEVKEKEKKILKESRELASKFRQPLKSIFFQLINLSEKLAQELNDTSTDNEVIEKYRDKIRSIGVVIYELTESEGILELALDCLPINTKVLVSDFWSDIGNFI